MGHQDDQQDMEARWRQRLEEGLLQQLGFDGSVFVDPNQFFNEGDA